MNRLRHMSIFAHIVELGSITAAAEQLKLSKSVVSQHLKALETELGLSLLKRSTRRQQLTPAGEDFYKHCKALNQQVEFAWSEARAAQLEPSGEVRITAPNALMGTVVAPALAPLLNKYPKLSLSLISSDQHLALLDDNIDLAIRVGASQVSNLKQRRIGEFHDVLCAGKACNIDSINEHSLYIANNWQGHNITHHLKHRGSGKVLHFNPQKLCHVDSCYSLLELIKANAGIGLLPDFLLARNSTNVQAIFADYELPINPVYALHPYNKLPSGVAACLEAIATQFDQLHASR